MISDKRTKLSEEDGNNETSILDTMSTIKNHLSLIISSTLIFAAAGFIYATFHPGKPDVYVAKALIEIGRYKNSLDDIAVLEPPADLAAILQKKFDITANPPRGTYALIEIQASNGDQATARQILQTSIEFIEQRHRNLADSFKGKQNITKTQLVSEPEVSLKSLKSKRPLITLIGAFLGILISALLIFTPQHTKKRLSSD